jgi:glycosyltransferase involved in cell wall biosynthesis
MRALFVYAYPLIFDADSADRARMRAYAGAIGELHVLSALPRAHEEQDGKLYLHGVAASRLMRPRALRKRARELIDQYSIEVVSAQDPFEEGWAAMKAARGTNAKLHVQLHTDPFSPWYVRTGNARMSFLNRIRRRLADKVLPGADGIRTVSKRVKSSLLERYGARIKEPSIIPIAVDAESRAAEPLPAHSFTFALIAVSRVEPEKRIKDILQALAQVVVRYPHTGLFIVGDGRERKSLESLARSLGIGRNVVFMGERTAYQARAFMQSADAFIQASAFEGYGMTFIEAALAKLPLIVTDVGIVGELLKDGESALVAPVADPAALARHIRTLIEDNRTRSQLALAGEAAARAHLAAEGDHPARVAADLARLIS